MPYTHAYDEREPARAEVDTAPGLNLIEFGAPWCPHCIAAQAPLVQALTAHDAATHLKIAHLKIEDGPGRPLGRSFRIKLWPTLVLMRDGVELARAVRPTTLEEIERLFASAR
jgi:thioredoxin 1